MKRQAENDPVTGSPEGQKGVRAEASEILPTRDLKA